MFLLNILLGFLLLLSIGAALGVWEPTRFLARGRWILFLVATMVALFSWQLFRRPAPPPERHLVRVWTRSIPAPSYQLISALVQFSYRDKFIFGCLGGLMHEDVFYLDEVSKTLKGEPPSEAMIWLVGVAARDVSYDDGVLTIHGAVERDGLWCAGITGVPFNEIKYMQLWDMEWDKPSQGGDGDAGAAKP